jgi:hypothetical protein
MTLSEDERSEVRSDSGIIPEAERSVRVTLAHNETQALMRLKYHKHIT